MPVGLYPANTGDSAARGGFRIKGIDFRYGFSGYNLSEQNEVSLLQLFSNDQNNYYKFGDAKLEADYGMISDLYLGFVLVPNFYIRNKLFYKEEFRIGLCYSVMNSTVYNTLQYDTIQNGQEKEIKNFEYYYKYSSQRINLSYILNSRILKNNVAFYAGIGTSFGFATWRTNFQGQSAIYRTEVLTLQNNIVSNSSKVIPLENFSTGCASFYVPVGFKYNLSCDINLFSEGHFGFRYYMNGLSSKGTWIPEIIANFGFRYKIIDDEVDHTKKHVFW